MRNRETGRGKSSSWNPNRVMSDLLALLIMTKVDHLAILVFVDTQKPARVSSRRFRK